MHNEPARLQQGKCRVSNESSAYFSAPALSLARAFSSAIALRMSRASGAAGASWMYFSYALRAASSS